MDKMNTSNTPDSQDIAKKPVRSWTTADDLQWEIESGDTRDKLASEIIEDAHYKEYVPALKTKFNELFGFEPQVTNSFILDLHDFKDYHTKLLANPSDEDWQELTEYSRGQLRGWVVEQISEYTYIPDMTEEYQEQKRKKIDEATAKIDQFYGWIFQNIPLRPKRAE